jgi:hypothetical protein
MRKLLLAAAVAFGGLPFAGLTVSFAAEPLSDEMIRRQGPFLGQISNGQCNCKGQCDRALSIFTENGRTANQCYRKCEAAFSGCSVGEVRSNVRRDL